MAPIPRSGKGTRVLFGNSDMSGILQNVTIAASGQALKTTVYQNNDETYIPGLRDGTVNYEGLFDGTALSTASTATTGALDARFQSALAASTQPIVTIGVEGDTIGRRARLFRQETIAYTAMSPCNDVVKVAAAGQISGRHDAGVWLLGLAARTSTSSTFSGVNSGIAAGTTSGGVGHFHMTADSTVTSFVAKVQHSSSATAWADLITFTASTATSSVNSVQRSTVAGTVKRHTRAIISTFTGGAGKTATVAVAFSRRGPRSVV